MSHIYKKIDVVGSSETSIENAIEQALARASESVHHIEWFEIDEIRGHVVDGKKIGHYQVGLKLGFRFEEK